MDGILIVLNYYTYFIIVSDEKNNNNIRANPVTFSPLDNIRIIRSKL